MLKGHPPTAKKKKHLRRRVPGFWCGGRPLFQQGSYLFQGSLRGVPREQKMLMRHLPRVKGQKYLGQRFWCGGCPLFQQLRGSGLFFQGSVILFFLFQVPAITEPRRQVWRLQGYLAHKKTRLLP